MKYLMSLLMLSLLMSSKAQVEFKNDLGAFKPEEINYKECPFDKDAEAVVFYDRGITNFDEDWNMITNREVRMKILKEKGVGKGNIRILYYSNDQFETIRDIEAVVVSTDDQKRLITSKLNKKNIFNTKLNSYYSEITFALPDVRAGSLIEYRYTSFKKSYGGLRNWVFQWDIPVLESFYNLYIIPNHEFTYSVQKSRLLPIDIKTDEGNVKFTMKNIPGLRDEAFIGSRTDYLQQVKFQLSGFKSYFGNNNVSTTWKELAKEMMDAKEFGVQLNKDISNTEDLNTLVLKAEKPFDKMAAVYNYVRFGMAWNDVYSLYSEDGIKYAWEKKRGNTADINLLLVNLLKANGLEAYPVLISERDHGKVDSTYPFRQQFNKVAACVALDGKYYFLDGVDKTTPAGLTPFQFLNTKAFIVDRKKFSLLTITEPAKQKQIMVSLFAAILPDGAIQGESTIYNMDYARLDKMAAYGADIKKYKENYTNAFTGIKIDSFKLKNLDSDQLPLTENFHISTGLNKSGDYYLLNYNLFSGYNKNPFVSDNRFSNIDFGCSNSATLVESFTLPDNFKVESLPKNSVLRTPDNSMTVRRMMEKQNNVINIQVRINIIKTEFTPEEYPMVKDFYKQMLDYLNEPIVLQSK